MKLIALAVFAALVLGSCSQAARNATPSPSPAPVATGDYPMYGHAADFSWVSGRVERTLSCIYVRFGGHKQTIWGGSLAVVPPAGADGDFGEGDMIVVKGKLVRLSDGACGSPSYLVSSFEEH